MKVFFTGDLFLGGDLLGVHYQEIVKSKLYEQADFRVVNLEQAVSDSDYIEDKCTLYTGAQALKQLSQMKVDAVNLAHNHIQDKGLDGIGETVDLLNKENIKSFGAGINLQEASKAIELTENIVLLGYCEFDKPYLKQIEVADSNKPGVNPLRYEKIIADLGHLQPNQQAILYFHWGMEHVWLPPISDIKLARKLLKDDRVAAIIGMHSHRVQGIVSYKGKKAYMGLGNFLFPNFYIAPPTQIFYPTEKEKQQVKFSTRQYHAVYDLTYKKWRLVNRISRVLLFDTKTHEFKSEFVNQKDDIPKVEPVGMLLNVVCFLWTALLSGIYKMPTPIYNILYKLHAKQTYFLWRSQILFFHLRQLGVVKFYEDIKIRIRRKLK
ncbi:CapA family protein [Vibrio cholerae]|uniref:CapA family protein n=1 Tax=Vibrio cholerae TaxID=666 RepID=UPI002271081C|nr:CapA family protein [Vibrio cholerae]MCX9560072.1 CapA family protein [Vibrio cholerae]MCX9562037.1 CapA family protein [Vibrio cholerae]